MNVKGIAVVIGVSMAIGAFAQVRYTERLGTVENMNRVKPGMGVTAQDRKYFAEARITTVYNLRAAEIARRKGGSSWLNEFAEFRAKDYDQNYKELKVIASKLNLRADKSLPRAWEQKLNGLRAKNGGDFENAFRVNFVKINEQFADQSEREAKRGNNSLIRNFAVTQGPVIRLNINMAMRGVAKI